ncbi:MAG TPA: putative selenate ABC transporter substrate-binding protein [Gemmatimonadaceae bacterium]|nr:putative selenate ABC transporter substrate-binding protein [Gemmatimonadaceae bacterium]
MPSISQLVRGALLAALLTACRPAEQQHALVISAIPDQDPEKLQRLYGKVSMYLSGALHVPVEYRPVTDYTASVIAFKTGDLDLVWYGGLTGVQARLQVPGAHALAQRDIDTAFHAVFITRQGSGIRSLADLKGHTFTFGSEMSTSGRLMPQFYLGPAIGGMENLRGAPGFSGSHDKTIALVTAGTYDAGALNAQVWKSRIADHTVDTTKVAVFYMTPAFHDYHWVLNPAAEQRFGAGFGDKVRAALLALDPSDPTQKEILDLFGAHRFVETADSNYIQIERVARAIGAVAN